MPLGPARQRAVLAVLLVEPGAMVSLDQLADRVWGARPPRSIRQTLHTYVSRLRSALGDAGGPRLEHRSGGYVLSAEESAVDLHRFRALVAEARGADDDRAAVLWPEALGLWRGEPFAGLDSDWLRSVAVALEGERLSAVLDHHEVVLRSGQHARLLPAVTEASAAYPLDERLAAQLMLTLYRCGRQAEALEHYEEIRRRLDDELGTDPGPELRDLHQRILRHDPRLTAPARAANPDPGGAVGAGPSDRPTPAQLPLDVAGFTGRDDDLRRLDQLVSGPASDPVSGASPGSMSGPVWGRVAGPARQDLTPPGPGGSARPVVIATISGTAGVGKTALAVHWAHRVADQFPDGQLYVNLRGYDPDQPMRPADALARFLTALGVPERDIPLDDDERAARYRSELAGRRMLIVLDNAGSVAQVRPLLPGGGSSLVVITSRDSLAGLVAVHGVHEVRLDLLSPGESVGLLHRLIGDRVAAEPAAAATLAEQCARLPLALRVAAVLATSRPERPLAEVVAELTDRQDRLELLDPGGDPYAAVHAVFSWSIQHLPEQAAHTFRRLGLHPGPDLDPYVAAAVTGLAPQRAHRILDALVNAHLLHRTGPDRYAMHDLLRAYATHLTTSQDTGEEREAAARRLLAYYQDAAVSAMDALHPADVLHRPEATTPGVLIPDLSRPDAARRWLESERFCVIAIAEHAAEHHLSAYVSGLARILHRYVGDTHLTDLLTINGYALRAAERTGDRTGRAYALLQLGTGYTRVTEYEPAIDHLQRALDLFREIGDTAGEARALGGRGIVRCRLGSYDEAIEDHRAAIALARRDGDRAAEAVGLINLGIVEERMGNYLRAAEIEHQTLAIMRDIGARNLESVALNNLANAEMELGRYTSAIEHVHQALAIIDELGSPMNRAHTLDTLGALHLRLGEPRTAGTYFRQALAHYRRIGERNDLADSINGLGEVAQITGDPVAALSFHTEALAIATVGASRQRQARAHAGIADAHRALGDTDRARTHYEQAHLIYAELDKPEADEVHARLGELSAAAP
ncbi:tetratricopeptide repeat protein [Myceligenerans sp. TRM 65318]|uniref:Tetratricopeptide repeat protein n=1 Tax=Myceligenerans pegani TaxID=2776917 RepID=A0ABR9MXH9_9MICO|nr:tetratricopeptide repeat protein [Myceligenerans sp. TRM 65318]MBE3018366.1 tetratricopeptide repeat protein [Myceligenerans sp. TRM 65318]